VNSWKRKLIAETKKRGLKYGIKLLKEWIKFFLVPQKEYVYQSVRKLLNERYKKDAYSGNIYMKELRQGR